MVKGLVKVTHLVPGNFLKKNLNNYSFSYFWASSDYTGN